VDEGLLLLLVGAILAASIVVALGAARTGLPVLVAFLGLGMLLGSDRLGGSSSTTRSLRVRSAPSGWA
jgi:NhaP-type Na+/H+ and K+/H+ antiporter